MRLPSSTGEACVSSEASSSEGAGVGASGVTVFHSGASKGWGISTSGLGETSTIGSDNDTEDRDEELLGDTKMKGEPKLLF